MKKNILIKQIIGTDSMKQDLSTGVMAQTWKDTMLSRKDESSFSTDKAEKRTQPIDEFRYSQRCYCGIN
ncbi:hypothetical protein [Pelosinus sp. sgz500959]|uniref:hypothetical protein n=1 Tax=Pelosinus sp. sgz500959 TaxID=3242472 RepID=UPI00366DE90D